MDKLNKNIKAVTDFLKSTAEVKQEAEKIYEQLIFDYDNRHFMMIWLGFSDKGGFTDKIMLHFSVKDDGKIWVFANWTEIDVAETLIESGVLSSDIVLGFQPKHIREISGFAVA